MNINALWKIEYGMYIVSSVFEGKPNGQIANTVFQITAVPPLLAISINKLNLTHEYIEKSGIFTISALAQCAPLEFIGRFGFRTGRNYDKFAETKHRVGVLGAPIILENTTAFFECKVVKSIDCGTHTLFIAELIDADIIDEKEQILTYSDYHLVKQGKTPKNATTYISSDKTKKE
jgi:ferric-chelate reductase [NAD(P)H]